MSSPQVPDLSITVGIWKKSRQNETRRQRDAWQFIDELTVMVLSYEQRTNQVEVEMQDSGRLQGTTWFLDADALVQ